MANIATILTTNTAIVPAMEIRLLSGNYETIVGAFSFQLRGKIFSIIGSESKLNFDLTADTVTINGTPCDVTNVMSTIASAFVK